ncbi:MAG: hypothetical protein JWR90_2506 [Marmoricola sp.]|jgi:hypothetical protein|nr:hypothetical protein [Marmoricola sp.]
MDDVAIDEYAEQLVHTMAIELTHPHERECVICYVLRMLDEFGCDTTLRFARDYRDLRAPRATALEARLGSMGGFCDCEIFLNGMRRARHLRTYDEYGDEVDGKPLPPCAGVRRGSTQGCAHWVRRRRGPYGEDGY